MGEMLTQFGKPRDVLLQVYGLFVAFLTQFLILRLEGGNEDHKFFVGFGCVIVFHVCVSVG